MTTRLNSNALKALLASGVAPEDVKAEAGDIAELADSPEVADDPVDPEGDPEKETAVQAADTPAAAPAAADTPVAIGGLDSLLSKLAEVTTEAAQLRAEVAQLKAMEEAHQATTLLACTIIRKAANRLSVPLNTQTSLDETSSLSDCCAQFSKLDAQFEKRFPTVTMSRTGSDVADKDDARVRAESAEMQNRLSKVRKTTTTGK
jgi:hypothetical protein